MKHRHVAPLLLALVACLVVSGCSSNGTQASETGPLPTTQISGVREVNPGLAGSSLLGSPSDKGILINTLAQSGMRLVVNFGLSENQLDQQTQPQTSADGAPIVTELSGLRADTEYFYSVAVDVGKGFFAAPTRSFHTQRATAKSFSFGVQGDSHPEREGSMFDPEMYHQALSNADAANLDFYMMMGDDFSIDKLIVDGTVSQETVNERYLLQRTYLDNLGSSAPIFAVNGNHEQAAKYLLNGTTENPAVYAGNARNTFFPLSAPNEFYSGDASQVEGVGYLRDYFAYTWGDALFVVIDPYWHSENVVDNTPTDKQSTQSSAGKGKKTSSAAAADNSVKRDLWDNTLGQEQYDWLVTVLGESTSKYKFVFTHHVLGTGRGGIEEATLYEWGGYDKKGQYRFDVERPNWVAPIQQLMSDNNVTIFFQGHDHLFAQQELDGVEYQTVPCPADPTFTAFNANAYTSGTILPNSGYLKVDVSPTGVTVNYIATGGEKNGQSIYNYTLPASNK